MNPGNKIFLNPEGYIEIVLVGDQTAQSFERVYQEAEPIIEQLKTQGKPLYALFDLSKQTGFSLSSDKAALELLEEVDYDRIAMYSVPHQDVTKGIIMATGKADKTKIFETRDQALTWLLATDAS